MSDSEKEIDYKTGYGCVTIVLSLIAVVCSLFAMATVDIAECCKNSDCITITLLGTIVTLLVAWQIWQTIDAKHNLEIFEKQTKEYETKINNIQTEFDNKTILLAAQGERLSFLIDAHSRFDNAKNETDVFAASYRMYAEAVELFIKSMMPPMYDPLQQALLDMSNILENIEADSTQWRFFLDDESIFDQTHLQILNAINQHQMALDGIIAQITALNKRRHQITDRIKKSMPNP